MTSLQITLAGAGALALMALILAVLVLALCFAEERAQPTREYDPLARDYYQRSALAARRGERWG